MVAFISNGTAILGLGNLGALASKPVMEGKAVLFKRFADINAIDFELDSEDADEIIKAISLMGPTFGGINLEDIKAPECFIIEQRLKEIMDIPVFHDDQHGTAVICAAGLINALEMSGKKIENCKIVLNGAGAAGIACLELLKTMGARHDNCIMCDTKGVVYQGRTEGMNQWKSAHAARTDLRTATTLLDARAVAGARGLVDALHKAGRRALFDPAIEPFLDALARDTEERHERFGGSLYLLDADNLGGNTPLQSLRVCSGGIFGALGAWSNGTDTYVFTPARGTRSGCSGSNGVMALRVENGATMSTAWCTASVANAKTDFGYSEDAPLIVRSGYGLVAACGLSAANGIVVKLEGGLL
jgi:hypothetical protein